MPTLTNSPSNKSRREVKKLHLLTLQLNTSYLTLVCHRTSTCDIIKFMFVVVCLLLIDSVVRQIQSWRILVHSKDICLCYFIYSLLVVVCLLFSYSMGIVGNCLCIQKIRPLNSIYHSFVNTYD